MKTNLLNKFNDAKEESHESALASKIRSSLLAKFNDISIADVAPQESALAQKLKEVLMAKINDAAKYQDE